MISMMNQGGSLRIEIMEQKNVKMEILMRMNVQLEVLKQENVQIEILKQENVQTAILKQTILRRRNPNHHQSAEIKVMEREKEYAQVC